MLGIRWLLGLPLAAPTPPVRLRLGTTRGTNALLTRRGARTALITTRGFGDLPDIGYQNRPRLFDLTIRKPPRLAERVIEVDERMAADGAVLAPLDEDATRNQLHELRDAGIESLAICLLHADLYPAHEQTIERLAREAGFAEVSRSSAVAPLVKLVSRGDTTTVDAYLNPVLRHYLADLADELPGSEIRVMTSSGGLATPSAYHGHQSVLSGPAGGVVGYARVAAAAGCAQAIGFDMGGTSTDVSRYDGQFDYEYETEKAGVRLVSPTLAIDTVAAGGGSICGFDGVKLTVGPDSAGADPGPACYGRGGPLTVTDVNVWLGRVVLERFPFRLDRSAIERRLSELSKEVADATGERMTPSQLASGLLRIANANMARAIHNVTVAKGRQPGDYVMVAFGGAAGQHACAVAAELGIRRVLDHSDASLLSAYGIGLADITRHAAVGVYRRASELGNDELDKVLDRLQATETAAMIADGVQPARLVVRRSLDVRYVGVEAALSIPYDTAGDDWREQFRREHQQQFGYEHHGRELEVAVARIEVVVPSATPLEPSRLAPDCSCEPVGEQSVEFAGVAGATPVFDRGSLQPGACIDGPALVAGPHSTLAVDPGWSARMLTGGEMLLANRGEQSSGALADAAAPEAVLLEVFNNRLAGVAERMGHTLRRTASSVNVKERLDYSCAVFNGAGDLAANAPHVPVHLGGMGATIRALLADNADIRPGDVFLTNDPYRGGSHLPDLTVAMPVHDETTGELLFWTACRAHHAEIGGVRPGSMPPRATTLGEEGVVIANFLLVREGESREERLRELLTGGLYPTRAVEENLADVRAQLAAVRQGSRELAELATKYGRKELLRQIAAIQTAAETKVRAALANLTPGERRFIDYLETADGVSVPISVRIEIGSASGGQGTVHNGDSSGAIRTIPGGRPQPPAAVIDFTGTAPPVVGNLNANPAIVSAAVLYVLRLLVADDIPLNEGALRAVKVILPECLLNPPRGADPSSSPAVAAGNVETSQRVVDVLLGALGVAAASQGTMNNLLFGNDRFGYYETVAGGAGAGDGYAGASALHTHMTNTAITDAEILEMRFPVRLWRFAVRGGSGGEGCWAGGDGVVREFEFLTPLTVSMLTQHRIEVPYGMNGGGPGCCGEQWLQRFAGGAPERLPASVRVAVQSGDRLTLMTPGGGGYGQAKMDSMT
ncbi:MAG: hydantoinase B/oxoprolinase family protein [Verrucomicrobiales bacterium]|nr:hydantoinase B/oxoprolinase family protein [Verrucomicrobiales bacterium]